MSDQLLNTTLAILAGGEGSRMGRPKGLLNISGRPILAHILGAARWPGPTLLITSPGKESPPGSEAFNAQASDPVAGLGPMRGVLTALENASTERIVVAAVDMPSIGSEIFRWLAAELDRRPAAQAILMERRVDNRVMIEPLPAAFRKSALKIVQERLRHGKDSLSRLSECKDIQVVRPPEDWPAAIWTNLNFPRDLARLRF
jgi:molybdopterin-guanine dinucleotide biosynthesis protein A